ncbi:MAG: sensor histidine kinase [Candidatus Cyclobacteriaceae bacterium M3_2C_046]
MPDILFDYIDQKAHLIFIKFDNNGQIVQANNFARQLIHQDLNGQNIQDIILNFGQNFDINKLVSHQGQMEKHLLNLITIEMLPETFYCFFYEEASHYIMLGESNYDEHQMLKKELLQSNNELDNLSRELYRKNAEWQKLNEMKDQFISIAAHDLRNPLGNILRLSEFLVAELGTQLTEAQKKFLELIQSLSSFGLRLLNDLLDLAKLDSGKLNLKLEQVDITKIISTCIEFNHYQAQLKNIELLSEIHQDFDLMEVDRTAIQQVLDNLVNNAIKFSPDGSQVRIGIMQTGDIYTLFVKDQGPGIPENELEKLFFPFSRTSVRPTSGEKSTGLGLSIVKKIVSSHGGKIWVESKLNLGSTFYFSLPVKNHKEINNK